MILGRASRRRLRLSQLSCLLRPLPSPSGPLSIARGTARRYAVASASPPTPGPPPPLPSSQFLPGLLRAIQTRNVADTREYFLDWTEALREALGGVHNEQLTETQQELLLQAQNLPRSTVSEILRNMDPVRNPEMDIAYGLRLALQDRERMDMDDYADERGLRPHHVRVLRGMHVLLEVRLRNDNSGFLPHDYEIMMRCSGAAGSYNDAAYFWGCMVNHGWRDYRGTQSWIEFAKARFLIRPQYQQWDRTRILLTDRDTLRRSSPGSEDLLEELDAERFKQNAGQAEPWNRTRLNPTMTIARYLSKNWSVASFDDLWSKACLWPIVMTEDALATAIVGFSRSSSLFKIENEILAPYFGIQMQRREREGLVGIRGVEAVAVRHPIRPTIRLIEAVIDAYGSMRRFAECLRLVDFISQRFKIAVTGAVWSRLLDWTFVLSTDRWARQRRIVRPGDKATVGPGHLLKIWAMMTSKPANIQPSYDDYFTFIKAVAKGAAYTDFDEIIQAIRSHILPNYRRLVDEHQAALLDSLLRQDASKRERDRSQPTDRLRRAALERDYEWTRIHKLVDTLCKSMRAEWRAQSCIFMPRLLEEFGEFLPQKILYATKQGTIEITRPWKDHELWRVWQGHVSRETLPVQESAHMLPGDAFYETPSYKWPTLPPLKVEHFTMKPYARAKDLGMRNQWVPSEDRVWKKKVVRELLL